MFHRVSSTKAIVSSVAITYGAIFFAGTPHAKRIDHQWVSLINLIATPERYHQKQVLVSGYVKIEFENQVICLEKKQPSGKECLWLNLPPEVIETEEDHKKYLAEAAEWKKRCHGKLVTLRGVFDMNNKGHFDSQSGTLGSLVFVSNNDGDP